MKILWIDTETTGTDYRKHGIIQLAFLIDIDGKVVEEREFRMNPNGKLIDKKALDVNKITLEEIHSYPLFTDVKIEIEALFAQYIDRYNRRDKFYPAGYRVRFDIDFLHRLWEDCGDEYFFSWIYGSGELDPFWVVPFFEWVGIMPVLDKRDLGSLARYFDIPLDAHDAVSDIRVTREIAMKIKEMIPGGKEEV